MNLKPTFAAALAAATLAITSIPSNGQEWTRFRGPNGSGISQAKSIPAKIGEDQLKWKFPLPGSGHSSPVVWGDQVFVTCTGDKEGGISVVCVSASRGQLLWKRDFALSPFSRHRLNSFASATPSVDAKRVYVVWNEPDHYFLTALDHQGKTVWQRDFGPFVSQHACGTSPIVYENQVILANFQDEPKSVDGPNPDGRTGRSSIIAVSAETGETIWQTPRRSTVVHYSTPCVFQPKGGKPALIFNSQSHGISAVDPANGKVLWEYANAFDKRSVSSPLIAGDLIFGSCGSGGGGNVLTAIRASGTGGKPELAYQIKKAAPYVPTSVIKDDLMWLWSDAGIVSCVTTATGDIRFQERVGGNYFGSPVWIAGKLYCVSGTGELVVVEASDKFSVLHRYALNEQCHSTLAVAGERLFIHTQKHLWAFGSSETAAFAE